MSALVERDSLFDFQSEATSVVLFSPRPSRKCPRPSAFLQFLVLIFLVLIFGVGPRFTAVFRSSATRRSSHRADRRERAVRTRRDRRERIPSPSLRDRRARAEDTVRA